ncbi:MAG: N-acetylneuraminate synthase family protein [Proteobacteria bacterium]|nr:N-acetylneuraminate synthase family protein [Pseudomonadota bacterium]
MIEPITIKNKSIGPGCPPFVIAEACINHEGDINIAEQMVYMAHAMGADCIKFQIHVLKNEMLRDAPQSDNFEEPLWDTLDRTNLSVDEHIRLKKLCGQLGISYLCTPFSRDGTDIIEEIGVDFYKTGSGELTNLPLIEYIAKKEKPMIVSTGMCLFEEVKETVDLIKSIGTPLILTHCVSAYPTPYEIVNLGMIQKYKEVFQIPVGLSDHSRGIYTALGAVGLGACVLEKHFTLDKMQKGPDHASSIEPYELGELVKGARAISQALGAERKVFSEEKQIVTWARESVVSEVPIPVGTKITSEMVWVKRPGPGPDVVPAKDLSKIVGKVAKADIPKDVQIKWSYIEE